MIGMAGAIAFSGSVAAGEVRVFAAASLKTALDAVAAEFHAETGHRVVASLAGSSALARQIQHGAPADIFISANPAWMTVVEQDGKVDPATRTDLLANRLVLIAPSGQAMPVPIDRDLDLGGLLEGGRLAMALVDAVPAGQYGKAALRALDLWEAVERRVVQADNVRAALALVALGEARLGIVYATDALAEPRVSVIGHFPPDLHPPIVYPAAAVAGRNNPVATAFLRFLQSPAARVAFERHGFTVLAGETR